jgi:hypothetical protein
MDSNQSSSNDLAQKQAEFESLLSIQSQRRQKEDNVRQEEQRFAMREEKVIRDAYNLAMMRAAFHAEKISWKRAMEDEVRREEDTRRAMEDARRAIEDDRRRHEEQSQMVFDAEVKVYYEQSTIVDRVEKERLRRWIEEDRVRALEDILIRQDVLDIKLHASLRQHVHKHFDALIGYGAANKTQIDAQLDVLLDALFIQEPPAASVNELGKSSDGSLSLSSSGVLIEHPIPSEAPPSYQAVTVHPNPSDSHHSPSVASPANAKQSTHGHALDSMASAPISIIHTAPARSQVQSPTPGSVAGRLKRSNIDVDDFAVLDDEEPSQSKLTQSMKPPQKSASSIFASTSSSAPTTPAKIQNISTPVDTLSSSSSSSSSLSSSYTVASTVIVPPGPPKHLDVNLDEDPEFAFDMSIEPSGPLVVQDDWEVVVGRGDGERGELYPSLSGGRSPNTIEGASKSHNDVFCRFRGEHVSLSAPSHVKQLSKMLSEQALKSLLDTSTLADLNPFNKLVISARDTWESCDQCGTYFDRMSIKHTCKTCHRSFCSKCGLVQRNLDLWTLTSRVPEQSHEIRSLFPKAKEDWNVEVKCCSQCDKTLTYISAKDSHQPHQRSNFFIRQYEKSLESKALLKQILQALDMVTRETKPEVEIRDAETKITIALRKYQSSIDSVDQTINTIRSELPINPKTGTRYTSSTEIRTLTSIKTAMTTYLMESKQLTAHYKIRVASKEASQSSSEQRVTKIASERNF